MGKFDNLHPSEVALYQAESVQRSDEDATAWAIRSAKLADDYAALSIAREHADTSAAVEVKDAQVAVDEDREEALAPVETVTLSPGTPGEGEQPITVVR
jgi:hypothetical protein